MTRFTAAEASGDPTKLHKLASQEKFSDTDRARFTAAADSIDLSNAAKAEKTAADTAKKRAGDIQRSRDRAKAAQRTNRKGGGGGGGGGGKKPTEDASVDELISGAIGAATGTGPSKVAGSALSGTMLINVNNSVNITNGPVTIVLEVPASVLASGTPEDIADLMRVEVDDLMSKERAVAFDYFQARRAVGAG